LSTNYARICPDIKSLTPYTSVNINLKKTAIHKPFVAIFTILTNCKVRITQVHLGFKECTLMPEDGRGRPGHVGCNIRFSKYFVLAAI
jgi:hypothetical protein